MTSQAGDVRAIWHCCVDGVDLTPFTNRSVVYKAYSRSIVWQPNKGDIALFM